MNALTFSDQPPAFSETDQTSRLPRLFLLLSLKFIQTLINLSYPLNIPCIWSYEGSDRLYKWKATGLDPHHTSCVIVQSSWCWADQAGLSRYYFSDSLWLTPSPSLLSDLHKESRVKLRPLKVTSAAFRRDDRKLLGSRPASSRSPDPHRGATAPPPGRTSALQDWTDQRLRHSDRWAHLSPPRGVMSLLLILYLCVHTVSSMLKHW